MSQGVPRKKKKAPKGHWSGRVREVVVAGAAAAAAGPEGRLGFELRGGAEHGQFPFVGPPQAGPDPAPPPGPGPGPEPDELLLEVNETPVAGLTTRDVLAVIRHSKEPLRLKCVKPGL